MAPRWLDVIAWVSLLGAFLSAGAILGDILVLGNRQRMRVMELVWPITALYAGPLAWVAYARYGRLNSPAYAERHRLKPDYSRPVSIGIGISHCGAGCTLGDVLGEWTVFVLGLELAGATLWPELLVDFGLAFVLGIAFQYFAIAPMRDLGPLAGLRAALKADALSLLCFELGLFGWMAFSFFVLYPAPDHLRPDSPAYWLGMQIGMLLGFLTAWPANAWLIRRGIKEAM